MYVCIFEITMQIYLKNTLSESVCQYKHNNTDNDTLPPWWMALLKGNKTLQNACDTAGVFFFFY